MSQNLAVRITGVDASANCIHEATDQARKSGLESRISYHCGDAREWLSRAANLDGVFFHQSLHHFDRLDDLLRLVAAALKPSGIVYLDEYVGPARDEWRAHTLALHNLAYRLLPRSVRRTRLIRAPINRFDPTEAVNSSRIVTAVGQHLKILEQRIYGGNLLSVIYPNLRRPSDSPPSLPADFDKAVAFLLDLEEWWLRHSKVTGAKSYYVALLAVPKSDTAAEVFDSAVR